LDIYCWFAIWLHEQEVKYYSQGNNERAATRIGN